MGCFPAKLGPKTLLNGSGSTNYVERTKNQPRRPIRIPFRDHFLFDHQNQKLKSSHKSNPAYLRQLFIYCFVYGRGARSGAGVEIGTRRSGRCGFGPKTCSLHGFARPMLRRSFNHRDPEVFFGPSVFFEAVPRPTNHYFPEHVWFVGLGSPGLQKTFGQQNTSGFL